MKILLLAPHPFFQARGTPLAVRTVLEFLSGRGHHVDVLTLHEGEDVAIPNCPHLSAFRALPWIRNVRPGFSLKKVVCDAVMFVGVPADGAPQPLRSDPRGRGVGLHRGGGSGRCAGVPYVYDMDSSLAEQMVEAYPGLQFALPVLRYCESVAIRRSLGVLTVCAALEDVALGHDPGQAGRPGRGQHAAAAGSGPGDAATGAGPLPGTASATAARACTSAIWSATRASTCCSTASGTRCDACRGANLVIVGGREDDILHYREVADQLGILPRVHFLGPRPGEPPARACCGRPTCWCRPGSRASTRR